MIVQDVVDSNATVRIAASSDAFPFARAIARALSLNEWTAEARERLAAFEGVVGLSSALDSQAATVRSGREGIEVANGLRSSTVIDVNPTFPYRLESADSPSTALAAPAEALLQLLDPPLPPWPVLADHFWAEVNNLPGMPPLLLVDSSDGTSVRLGDAGRAYEIHGAGRDLAALLAGLEYLPHLLSAGRIKIRGTFTQLSVVAGASMKVLWNV